MATIDSRAMIDEIIADNGYYQGDARVHMIVEYTNAYGKIAWGITWSNEKPEMRERYLTETRYVKNPKVIWKAN